LYKTLIAILILTACSNKEDNIDNVRYLKDLGYTQLLCDQISYQKSDDESIDIWAKVKPIDPSLSMILARCSNNNCNYEEISRRFIPATAICQKFVITGDGHTPVYNDDSTTLIFNIERYWLWKTKN